MSDFTLSIVVTAHHEGRILVPTLRSLASAIHAIEQPDVTVEVVIVADRADEETNRIIGERAAQMIADGIVVVVVAVENGDLGASRNDGVRTARGEIVSILDGDNLVSSTWLAASLAVIERAGPTAVVHPEVIASFGARTTLWWSQSTQDADFTDVYLATVNYWDACVTAHRSIFEAVPYLTLRPSDGFGPEDWAWNISTIDRGFEHVVAAETALFYRTSENSLLVAHGGSLLPPLTFLSDLEKARLVVREHGGFAPRTAAISTRDKFRRTVPHRVRRPASLMIRAGRSVLRPWVSGARRALSRPRELLQHRFPDWLEEQWQRANLLEPLVPFLRSDTPARYAQWGAPWPEWERERAYTYWRLLAAIGGPVDFLFVAPWVRTGGGDRVLLQYMHAVRRLRPKARIVLLTTEPGSSTRIHEAPEGAVVIELGRYFSRWVDRDYLVSRLLPQLLTQISPQTMHVFNSTVGFDVVERFGPQIARNTSIFLSTFVLDRTPDGERTSVLFYRDRGFLHNVQAVIVDSEDFAQRLADELGYPLSRLLTLRQIVPELPPAPHRNAAPFDDANPLRVLWTGRFDLQKRLDVLAAVSRESARRELPLRIDFYGEEVMGDPTLGRSLSELEDSGAVRMPPYSKIDELGLAKYDVFLNTSEWEGVPNSVLEAMSAGLPVIAPAVGGIPEVVDDTVGYLISSFDDVAAYVDALADIIDNPSALLTKGTAARERVRNRFSAAAFDGRLERLTGYLDRPTEAPEPEHGLVFFADTDTRAILQSSDARAYLFCGSAGTANFGDILQPKNVVAMWREFAPDVAPLLFFALSSAGDASRIAELTRFYGCAGIVFYGEEGAMPPEGLQPATAVGAPGPVHVVGGGFLNRYWGEYFIRVIDELSRQFDTGQMLLSGMQLDASIAADLRDFVHRHDVVGLGARDAASLSTARAIAGDRGAFSFDDLHEAIRDWESPRDNERAVKRVGLHINASDYVGGAHVLDRVSEILAEVTDRYPDSELVVLNAYDDPRPEVVDTLASIKLLAESFPYTSYRVVDLAQVSLQAHLDSPVTPAEIADLDLDFAVTCSYHTTLLMHALGIPAYPVRVNEYYEQKAALFSPPRDFVDFLDDPDAYLLDLRELDGLRQSWVQRQAAWMRGGPFVPPRAEDEHARAEA